MIGVPVQPLAEGVTV
jgi:hypothetical protein